MKIKIALRNAGNAFLEYDDTETSPAYKTRIETHGAEASSFMHPLLEALNKARPTWEYRTNGYNRDHALLEPVKCAAEFGVYERDQKLGTLGTKWTSSGTAYLYTNHRTEKKYQRSNGGYSRDHKKAAKAVLTYFYARSLIEEAQVAVRHVSQELQRYRQIAGSTYHASTVNEQKAMRDFVFAHFDLYTPTRGDKQKLLEVHTNDRTANELLNAYTSFEGTIITLRSDRSCIVTQRTASHTSDSHSSFTDAEQLPPDLRTSLGILKLVPSKTHIPGHGFRVSETVFYVTPKSND